MQHGRPPPQQDRDGQRSRSTRQPYLRRESALLSGDAVVHPLPHPRCGRTPLVRMQPPRAREIPQRRDDPFDIKVRHDRDIEEPFRRISAICSKTPRCR
jgi:hypothetical protein